MPVLLMPDFHLGSWMASFICLSNHRSSLAVPFISVQPVLSPTLAEWFFDSSTGQNTQQFLLAVFSFLLTSVASVLLMKRNVMLVKNPPELFSNTSYTI